MRKLVALAVPALTVAALTACQPAPDATGDAAATMGATAAAPAMPSVDELMAVERSLWTAFGAHDAEPFRQNLTADYTQAIAGAPVTVGRDAVVQAVAAPGCELRSFDLQDAATRELAPGVIALSHTATQDASCAGMALPPKVYSMSIYVWRDGGWLATSYQETPVG
jgi:hypothetical protein